MLSIWRIKVIKGSYYLNHRDWYTGSLDKIIEVWRSSGPANWDSLNFSRS